MSQLEERQSALEIQNNASTQAVKDASQIKTESKCSADQATESIFEGEENMVLNEIVRGGRSDFNTT